MRRSWFSFIMQGRKFSIQGLLGNDVSTDSFIGGELVIFRLAPQVTDTIYYGIKFNSQHFWPQLFQLYNLTMMSGLSSFSFTSIGDNWALCSYTWMLIYCMNLFTLLFIQGKIILNNSTIRSSAVNNLTFGLFLNNSTFANHLLVAYPCKDGKKKE